MKITHHWLREFTAVDATAEELAKRLTLAGLEVESVTPVAPAFTGVIVGEVLTAGRHPNAEKLSLCEVTTDGVDRLQIVCGAPNVRAGLKVAVAMVGATLPGNIAIKRAKLRGLESNGMLCSARELGLGSEHDGIIELPSDLPLGQDVRASLDLDDSALEVNATPNRGDCMSVFGIARDYAAARYRRYLTHEPVVVPPRHDQRVSVAVEVPAACPVFGCRVVRGIAVGAQTPAWMRERLRRVGINSISPVVDVTNYVMMELGQPLHAYDLRRLDGGIRVRMARAGERLVLLDDKEYDLEGDFLVIADAAGPVGLAGIMGGRRTAIGDSTVDVLLEAAHFSPDVIAGRARRVGLFTDAGQRFERGVDPTLPGRALERATALLLEMVGGEPGPVQLVQAASPAAASRVPLRRVRLASLLGTQVPDDEVTSLLSAVTGPVERNEGGWLATAPPHRFDIRIEADLIEEVARLRGFDSIPERHAMAPQVPGPASEAFIPPERLATALADAGYREVITYSFVDPTLQRLLFPQAPALALSNAISAELSEMRVSLWSGLLQSARDNLHRQQTRVRLFEVGRKFELSTGSLREVETVAGIAIGARWPEQWGSPREPVDFYDVKSDLSRLIALTGDEAAFRFEAASLHCLRPGRSARILRGAASVGWLGELHPQLQKALGISSPTLLFELETETAFMAKPSIFKKISKFPGLRRDLAVVVDEAVPLAALQENVTVSASGLLSELRVFDVYRGPGVDSGRKSVALGLILQDSSRTLTDEDADAVVTAVIARLRDELSASIRDQ